MLSARTTLGLVLDALDRLLAPFLPFATEEAWQWMHQGEGSVHRTSWPRSEDYRAAAQGQDPDLLTWAGRALASLRRIKSEAKVSMKTPILSASLSVAPEGLETVKAALDDIAEAGRVTGDLDLVEEAAGPESPGATDDEYGIRVTASQLGEPPAKRPHK